MKNMLSKILCKLLTEANISETELARRTGIAQPLINQILSEKNTNPKIATLKPIADYFMVSIDQLVGYEPLPSDRILGTFNMKHKGWRRIPLIVWEKVNNPNRIKFDVPLDYVITDMDVSDFSYAMKMQGSSMEPIIPAEKTILIIDPEKNPMDRDFILVYIQKLGASIVKQLLIDGKDYYVKRVAMLAKDFRPS